MYLQTKGPTQIQPLIRERQLLVKRETSDNTRYLVIFIVGKPQLITLRLLFTHRLWVNSQRNIRFIGKSCDLIGYTDRTYQSVLKRSHDYEYFTVSSPTSDDWRVIDALLIVSYRQ
jgi:hypothetical protein